MTDRTPDRTEIAARLAAAVGRINRRARSDAASLGYGIVSALATVQREGPLRPGDLSRIEVVTKPTMTRILTELEQLDPRQARLVELRFYGGLTVEETATVLDISPATVKREWAVAKGWLHRALRPNGAASQN